MINKSKVFQYSLAAAIIMISSSSLLATKNAHAQNDSLIIINKPLPKDLRERIYRSPKKQPDISAEQISGRAYKALGSSLITGKIQELKGQLAQVQSRIDGLSQGLNTIQSNSENLSAQYYASIATINTQLQSGTTPGNPRLVEKLSEAQTTLEGLSENIVRLNDEAVRIASVAADTTFLLNSTRAAFQLSGALEEDHVQLAQLEDQVNATMVMVERILTSANDDISRTTAYLSSERENMRTLTLAVSKGDFYGNSLYNRFFSDATVKSTDMQPATYQEVSIQPIAKEMPQPVKQTSGRPESRRPLVRIKFDRNDVDYEQTLYVAVNEALQRFPNSQFDLVAAYPNDGNAAEKAIETTRARRNAERVLRTLSQIGLPQDRIDLSYDETDKVNYSEVHIYIR